VTDWHLPDVTGHALVWALAAARPGGRIVIFTPDDRVTGAAEAADAYGVVVKGGSRNELLAAVRA
jgi:hypothetical protein